MLVLTRKLQEKIVIGNDITVTILRVKGQQVRIGIEAPRNVRVIRGELPPMPTDREQPLDVVSSQDDAGPCLLEFEGTLAAEADSESVDADEASTVSSLRETVSSLQDSVMPGRSRPLNMQKFVQTVLEGALAK